MSSDCKQPLDGAVLADYWFGDLTEPEETKVEEHFFTCDACSARLRALATLGEGVGRLAQDGSVLVLVTPSFLETASAAGLHLREYRASPGERIACTVTPDDDLVLARLTADFRGVSRVDLVATIEGGPEQRLEDLAVGDDTVEVILAQSMPFLRSMRHQVMQMRLVSREKEGERVLGEYTFAHSPTPDNRP